MSIENPSGKADAGFERDELMGGELIGVLYLDDPADEVGVRDEIEGVG